MTFKEEDYDNLFEGYVIIMAWLAKFLANIESDKERKEEIGRYWLMLNDNTRKDFVSSLEQAKKARAEKEKDDIAEPYKGKTKPVKKPHK